jgi:hypothetical protein
MVSDDYIVEIASVETGRIVGETWSPSDYFLHEEEISVKVTAINSEATNKTATIYVNAYDDLNQPFDLHATNATFLAGEAKTLYIPIYIQKWAFSGSNCCVKATAKTLPEGIFCPTVVKAFNLLPGDIGIVTLTASKNVIGQGYIVSISFMVVNCGVDDETFVASVFANDTTIFGSTAYPIPSRHFVVSTFDWNTTAFAVGNYAITAYGAPVQGETDTTGNTISIIVKVTIPGDVNGDFFVNTFDSTQIGLHWTQAVPPASANVDVNGDGVINIKDATIVGVNWLKHA